MVLIAKSSVKIMSNISQMKGWVIHNEGGVRQNGFAVVVRPVGAYQVGGLMKTFHRYGFGIFCTVEQNSQRSYGGNFSWHTYLRMFLFFPRIFLLMKSDFYIANINYSN